MKSICIAIIFVLTICSISFALEIHKEAKVVVDLTQLSSQTRDEILNVKAKEEKSNVPSTEVAKNWINVGKEIGSAVNEMAKALNTNINEFAKTPVGRTAMFLLVYKLIGKEIIGKGIVVLIYIFCMITLIWSFRKFHINERVEEFKKNDKGNEVKIIKYIPKFEFDSSDAKSVSAAIHTIVFAVFTIVLMIIVY